MKDNHLNLSVEGRNIFIIKWEDFTQKSVGSTSKLHVSVSLGKESIKVGNTGYSELSPNSKGYHARVLHYVVCSTHAWVLVDRQAYLV